ncbi:MAG: winged helix-turn-helix transcriptional regulator, partial [Methanobacteriota archaeon]
DVTVDVVVRVAWRTVPRLSLADRLPLAPSAPAGAAAAAPWEGGLAVAPSQDGFASAASVHGGPGADPPRIAWGSGTAAQTETSWARFVATRAAPAGPGAIRWDPSPLVTAALATLFAIPAWALLRKLAREHVLAVPMRRDVLRAVQTQPGVNIREIAAALDVHYTTAQHHVRVLVEADFITVERIRGQLRCFANGGVFTSRERAIAAFSATAVARKLLGLLAERPGVDVRGLSESAATPRSTTSWNLRRLEGAGIAVRRFDDEGRERWVLAEDVPDALARIDAVRAAFRRG